VKLLLRPAAEQDLRQIAEFIAQDNARRAASYIRELREELQNLLRAPLGFALQPSLGPGVRRLTYGNYLIFYRVQQDVISVLRILHGARNLKNVPL
jgi:toxin ParE1/3/4